MTTQTAPRSPYMSISVQLDTPDAPPLDGRPVRLVSWTATRYDRGDVSYVIYAHHKDQAKDKEPLTEILRAEVIDPAIVPDWVPWPPANWLASLELGKPGRAAASAPDRVFVLRELGGVW